MSKTDNFDALWSTFKEQVKAAREQHGDRPMITTDGGSKHGANVNMWEGDEDGATMYITTHNGMLQVNCQPDDLRAFAAQCLAAAEEIEEALEEAQAVRPNMKPLPHIPLVPLPVHFPSIRTAK